MSEVLAFISGKGGVGKTTLVYYTGHALAMEGKKVLLVDCGAKLRNLDIVMGVENRVVFDSGDIFADRCAIDAALVKSEDTPNLAYLALSEDTGEAAVAASVALIRTLSGMFDFILLDCPAGIGGYVVALASSARTAVIVTTPQAAAVRDAERVAQTMAEHGRRQILLVINRIDVSLMKKGYVPGIDQIIDSTGVRLIGLLPEDPMVAAFQNAGMSVNRDPGSTVSVQVRDIAARLLGRRVPLKKFW